MKEIQLAGLSSLEKTTTPAQISLLSPSSKAEFCPIIAIFF